MGLLDFSIQTAGVELLPPGYKKPKHVAWIESLLKPLQDYLDNTYKPKAQDLNNKIKYNGQTIVLEGVLNHELGRIAGPFIYIENNRGSKPVLYFHNEAEGFTPHYFDLAPEAPVYIWTQAEVAPVFNFTVWVPVAAYQDYNTANSTALTQAEYLALVDSLVKKYKISGVNYNIQTY